MQTHRLAVGMKQGRVEGNFHWIELNSTVVPVEESIESDPRNSARGIILALALAGLMWVGIAALFL